jgi:hypothetical protein
VIETAAVAISTVLGAYQTPSEPVEVHDYSLKPATPDEITDALA